MDMAELSEIETSGLRGKIQRNEPMSAHVSWRAGGAADRTYTPADLDDLGTFVARLPQNEPLLLVGLGSNLLVRDGGYRGTVVFTHRVLARLLLDDRESRGEIYTDAGVACPKVARFAANHNLQGAEFLAGIPGTMGGALAMNAGCYGTETWDVATRVRTMDRAGRVHVRQRDAYRVGYRSVAALEARDEFFIGAWLQFAHGDGAAAREKIKTLLSKRIATQPLSEHNAGSVFRNPLEDHAARLIQASGLKGRQVGDAEVSNLHANFIINKGKATARDIESLINLVQTTVERDAGIVLEREVRIVGEA